MDETKRILTSYLVTVKSITEKNIKFSIFYTANAPLTLGMRYSLGRMFNVGFLMLKVIYTRLRS